MKKGICSKCSEKYGKQIYLIFRIFIGLLFLQHSFQKLFGVLGGKSVELVSLLGLAGVIELVVGLGITFGVFTRLMATIGFLEMITAYGIAHATASFWPIINGGEPALLYAMAFLILIVNGAGILSLEKGLIKKELF